MELEIENTEVVNASSIQVEVPNTVKVSEGKKDYEVSVVKKEYTIIGDSIFIPSMYEDAPPWLKQFIDTTIDVAVANRDQSLIDRMQAILTAMDYVPKNQYTEQINQIVSEDGIINSRIATLNSSLTDAINTTNATVAEINLTYASKDEAAAIANNVITASLSSSGEIGSALIQLQEAYATLESTTAQSISMLESVMEGEINGNATAMETIRTYVGIDEAGASTGTGLSAYLEASDGTIGGADSQLANDVRVTAEGVESKFAYNSIVNVNGIYKKSGFGLTTNYTSGSGTETDPYISEFWIDASRLKLTNSAKTGSNTPFTIAVSGTQPEITFNGKVNFSNITNVPQLGSTPQEVVTAINNAQTTTIDGPRITTGSIAAAQIQAGSITANKLSVSSLSSITADIGVVTAGLLRNSNYSTYINMNATNGGTFLNANGKAIIYANGNASFTGVVLSRDLVVAEGTGTASLINSGDGLWSATITIDTGLSGNGAPPIDSSYVVDCTHINDTINYSPANYYPPGGIWGVLNTNAVLKYDSTLTYITPTTHTTNWKIIVVVSFTFNANTDSISSITNFQYNWKLKKIT